MQPQSEIYITYLLSTMQPQSETYHLLTSSAEFSKLTSNSKLSFLHHT